MKQRGRIDGQENDRGRKWEGTIVNVMNVEPNVMKFMVKRKTQN